MQAAPLRYGTDRSEECQIQSAMVGAGVCRRLGQTIAVVAFFFAAVAPTLSWPEISGDGEVNLVQTVLQMRHGGPWWVPMLGDQPRTKKPPLPAWITASFVRQSTVDRLSAADPAVREAAYGQLAFETRLPALIFACLALLATGWTAEMIGGSSYALPSVLIGGTLYLFLRFIRLATADVYLMAWVAIANAFFSAAILRGQRWSGLIGGGVASGLALMSKGPPALAQTVLPVMLFVLARRFGRRREPIGPLLLPSCLGLAAMLAIALPWPFSVFLTHPMEGANWAYELRGGGTEEISHEHWWSYITLLPNLMPWLSLFFVGNYLAGIRWRRAGRMSLALMLLWVPVLVFSCFPLRKERYLLPMAGAAAILGAHAFVRMRRTIARFRVVENATWWIHWVFVSGVVGGLLVMGAMCLKRADGAPWYSAALSTPAFLTCVALIAIGLRRATRYTLLPLLVTATCMVLANAMFLYGWSATASGMSEMKPIADRVRLAFPRGQLAYFDPPPYRKPVTLDLDIYLDRSVPVVDKPPSPNGSIAVVLMLRREGAPEPSLFGWRRWQEMTTAKHHYHWYLLVPNVR